ncbi:hypothetical protein CSUI_009423 [Cystoisospora suis]|uniref:Uncharacterized protein n=1 Tax=Cystoisospora suis TaxID=483139 RepID=A0A2C6K3L0_9APIC|nr:hypothetical protein CSUI_009423 [Cystoisospora suis]
MSFRQNLFDDSSVAPTKTHQVRQKDTRVVSSIYRNARASVSRLAGACHSRSTAATKPATAPM